MLRVSCLFCVIVMISGLIGCGHNSPVASEGPNSSPDPVILAGIDEVLPKSFAEADSLYNALGTTMLSCTTSGTYGQLSVEVLKKTESGRIADVNIFYGRTKLLHDSVGTTDVYGIDVLVNPNLTVQNIAVVLGDKDYAGNARLHKLFVNGETVSVYPFGEAKLFGDDKIISYQYVGGQRGRMTKHYVVYDVVAKSTACSFDQ